MKNMFQIIHGIGSIQGLFLFFLLIMRKENKIANKVIAFLVLLFSINMATSFLHTNEVAVCDLVAIHRSDMFVFFYGPLILLYTLFLVGFRKKMHFKDLLHFVPAITLFLLLCLYFFYFRNIDSILLWDPSNSLILRIWYIIHGASLIHLLIYLLCAIKTIKDYKKLLNTYFSETKKIYLKWLQILLYFLMLIWILALLQFAFNSLNDSEGIISWMVSTVAIILIFTIGYFTYFQPDILNDLEEMIQVAQVSGPVETMIETTGDTKYQKNRLGESEEKRILNILLEYVEREKLYLEPTLTIKQLSEAVGISSHQISMLINTYLGQNFYTFINKYRIEEVKKKLFEDNSKENNILTIALETGFNSKSTFNTVFKKIEGVTPSEFRKQCKNE